VRSVPEENQATSLAGLESSDGSERALRQFASVSDGLVLAAIDRAERHGEHESKGVRICVIADHLGFLCDYRAKRGLSLRIDTLIGAGELVCTYPGKIGRWKVTDSGRQRIAQEFQAGKIHLPEAPQHRIWRCAREDATRRISEFYEEARQALGDAEGLLDSERGDSDAWFALAQRLRQTCWQLGSATFCLNEWAEPDDDYADIDDCQTAGDDDLDLEEQHRRQRMRLGRRQTRNWQESAVGSAQSDRRS
jgi:hypothetical protein